MLPNINFKETKAYHQLSAHEKQSFLPQKRGGQFKPNLHGHFKPNLGGQLHRTLHLTLSVSF